VPQFFLLPRYRTWPNFQIIAETLHPPNSHLPPYYSFPFFLRTWKVSVSSLKDWRKETTRKM
jgi:hypothetical protein